MEEYGNAYPDELMEYLGISAIPSHDTLQRTMQMINPAVLAPIYQLWCGRMDFPEETPELCGDINFSISTARQFAEVPARARKLCMSKAYGIRSAVYVWDRQRWTKKKSSEITAIPKILANLHLNGYIVTSDAMGTQTAIASLIRKQGGDYLLAVKGNQGTLYDDLKALAVSQEYLDELKKEGKYKKTVENAHGQIEIREYWQTDDLTWLTDKTKWFGVQSLV